MFFVVGFYFGFDLHSEPNLERCYLQALSALTRLTVTAWRGLLPALGEPRLRNL